jgi:hypothetical protein
LLASWYCTPPTSLVPFHMQVTTTCSFECPKATTYVAWLIAIILSSHPLALAYDLHGLNSILCIDFCRLYTLHRLFTEYSSLHDTQSHWCQSHVTESAIYFCILGSGRPHKRSMRVLEYFYEKQIKIIFADLSDRITICYK